MSNFTVIAGATRTLGNVINNATGVTVDTTRSPADSIPNNASVINLYLYRIEKNPFFENADWSYPNSTEMRGPPIGINLFYLVTPYYDSQLDVQTTIGQVIQTFHDMPVIDPADYDPVLSDATEELRVIETSLPLDQMSDLWKSFDQSSYRLSLTYEVSVVLIDSAVAKSVQRVGERHIQVSQRR